MLHKQDSQILVVSNHHQKKYDLTGDEDELDNSAPDFSEIFLNDNQTKETEHNDPKSPQAKQLKSIEEDKEY